MRDSKNPKVGKERYVTWFSIEIHKEQANILFFIAIIVIIIALGLFSSHLVTQIIMGLLYSLFSPSINWSHSLNIIIHLILLFILFTFLLCISIYTIVRTRPLIKINDEEKLNRKVIWFGMNLNQQWALILFGFSIYSLITFVPYLIPYLIYLILFFNEFIHDITALKFIDFLYIMYFSITIFFVLVVIICIYTYLKSRKFAKTESISKKWFGFDLSETQRYYVRLLSMFGIFYLISKILAIIGFILIQEIWIISEFVPNILFSSPILLFLCIYTIRKTGKIKS